MQVLKHTSTPVDLPKRPRQSTQAFKHPHVASLPWREVVAVCEHTFRAWPGSQPGYLLVRLIPCMWLCRKEGGGWISQSQRLSWTTPCLHQPGSTGTRAMALPAPLGRQGTTMAFSGSAGYALTSHEACLRLLTGCCFARPGSSWQACATSLCTLPVDLPFPSVPLHTCMPKG